MTRADFWRHRRNKASNLEMEKDAGQRNIAVLESKLASLHHELDVLSKLRAQADGSTHHQVLLNMLRTRAPPGMRHPETHESHPSAHAGLRRIWRVLCKVCQLKSANRLA